MGRLAQTLGPNNDISTWLLLNMKLQILPLYIPPFALLSAVLSMRTLRLRRTLRIAVGDGGNQTMLRAMRVHSNFAEYVLICLLLILIIELQGGSTIFIHLLCSALFIGRVSHAFGVSQLKPMGITLRPTLQIIISTSRMTQSIAICRMIR